MFTRSYKVKDIFVVYYNGIKINDIKITKTQLLEKNTTYVVGIIFLSPNYGQL
jgi:hypothetical protein